MGTMHVGELQMKFKYIGYDLYLVKVKAKIHSVIGGKKASINI